MISPRQYGGLDQKVATQQQAAPGRYPALSAMRTDAKYARYAEPMSLPATGGAVARPPVVPPAPQAAPPTPTTTQAVGLPSLPQRWSAQPPLVRTVVPAPAILVTQYDQSRYSAPPLRSGDLGPVAPLAVADGQRRSEAASAVGWVAAGALLAWALGSGR